MASSTTPGCPLSAYLYVLYLDEPRLAWEYLRRNLSYRCGWRSAVQEEAVDWGLEQLEDPSLDARVAHPVWRANRVARVRLERECNYMGDVGARFSLWALPGRKTLSCSDHLLTLAANVIGPFTRVQLGEGVEEGVAFSYRVSASGDCDAVWLDAYRLARVFASALTPVNRVLPRPSRVALAHMRILQARDAYLAGASQFEIAGLLFGSTAVERDWSPDSALRAQVRYLIRRGKTLSAHGYRALAGLPPGGDVSLRSKSP